MPRDIKESDWRHFKKVHAALLERFCQQTLDDLSALASGSQGTAHDRYLRAYEHLMERNDEMARAFDDFRRSTAVMQLAIMRNMGLLGDDDLSGFSEQIRQRFRAIDALRNVEQTAGPNDGERGQHETSI